MSTIQETKTAYKVVPVKGTKNTSMRTWEILRAKISKKWRGMGAVEEIRAQRTKTW